MTLFYLPILCFFVSKPYSQKAVTEVSGCLISFPEVNRYRNPIEAETSNLTGPDELSLQKLYLKEKNAGIFVGKVCMTSSGSGAPNISRRLISCYRMWRRAMEDFE
jgi:hypothetical protein